MNKIFFLYIAIFYYAETDTKFFDIFSNPVKAFTQSKEFITYDTISEKDYIIGHDYLLDELKNNIKNSDENINGYIITGPPNSGKELLAKNIILMHKNIKKFTLVTPMLDDATQQSLALINERDLEYYEKKKLESEFKSKINQYLQKLFFNAKKFVNSKDAMIFDFRSFNDFGLERKYIEEFLNENLDSLVIFLLPAVRPEYATDTNNICANFIHTKKLIEKNDIKALLLFLLQKNNLNYTDDQFNFIYDMITSDEKNLHDKTIMVVKYINQFNAKNDKKIITTKMLNMIKNLILNYVSDNEGDYVTIPRITLQDIIGYDDIKQEILTLINDMRDSNKLQKNIILYGPMGNGKTKFAEAIAGSANIHYINVNLEEIMKKYITLDQVFSHAALNKPCIIFFDEFENLHSFFYFFLTLLDGLKQQKGVTIIAATNYINFIDQRLLRQGRFSKHFHINNPNNHDREKIIAYYLNSFKIDLDKNIFDKIVVITNNANIAFIKSLCLELKSFIEAKKDIDENILYKIFLKMEFGLSDVREMDEDFKKQLAFHEVSHAYIQYLFFKNSVLAEKPKLVTIIPNLHFYGASINVKSEKIMHLKKESLLAEIQVLLAGRAAQEIFFDTLDSGAQNDLIIATDIAYNIVNHLGLDKKFSSMRPSYYNKNERSNEVKESVEKILSEQYDKVKTTLNVHKCIIEALAKLLLEKNVIDYDDIDKIYNLK